MRLRDGERAERARLALDLLQPERLAQLELGAAHAGGPAASAPEAAPADRSGGSSRSSAATRCVSRAVSSRMRPLIARPSRSFTARGSVGARAAAASSPEPASDDENSSPATSTAIRAIPTFVTMPPGSAPLGSFTHCFQLLTRGRPSARTASPRAGRRSGANRRPSHDARCRGRPRRPARVRPPARRP